jgi:polar amino acid transport system substrate-binding protein
MSKVRTLAAIACALVAGVSVTACGGDDGGSEGAVQSAGGGSCVPRHEGLKTITPGTLTVSAYVSPPYTVEDGDVINGVDGLIVQRIAKMECLTLDARSVAGAALPSTVQSRRADMAIGGVYYSEERAAGFSLSIPMYEDGLSLLSEDGVSSIDGLRSTTLGVIQGYLWNKEFQKALGSGKVKTYQTSTALIADIENGRVGAGAFTSAEAGLRAKQSPGLKAAMLEPTPAVAESTDKSDVVLFMNKDATELTSAMNDDLKALLADGTVAEALRSNGVDPSLAATGT